MKKLLIRIFACTLCVFALAQEPWIPGPQIPPVKATAAARDATVKAYIMSLGTPEVGADTLLGAMSEENRENNYRAVWNVLLKKVQDNAALQPGRRFPVRTVLIQATPDTEPRIDITTEYVQEEPPADSVHLKAVEYKDGRVTFEVVNFRFTTDLANVKGHLEAIQKESDRIWEIAHPKPPPVEPEPEEP